MTAKSRDPRYAVRYSKFYRAGYRRTTPALGPMRRIQALHAIGYSRSILCELTGLSDQFLYDLTRGRFTRIDAERARTIAEVYRARCVQPLHNGKPSASARTWARKAGYYPPMAWNDIDDPKERPRGAAWQTTCTYRVNRSRYHPEGRPCGKGGRLRRGLCEQHYRAVRKQEAT